MIAALYRAGRVQYHLGVSRWFSGLSGYLPVSRRNIGERLRDFSRESSYLDESGTVSFT